MLPGISVARERKRARRRHRVSRVGVYAAAIGFSLVAAAPLLWGGVTAFKQNQDLYNINNNPFIFNRAPTLHHITYLLGSTPFLTFVRNTLFIGACVVAIT